MIAMFIEASSRVSLHKYISLLMPGVGRLNKSLAMPTRPINAVVLHEILHQANGAFEDISGDQFNAILKYEKPCSSVVRALNEAGSKPQLILTFDDGHQSDFDIVFPLLKDAGATATFFHCP